MRHLSRDLRYALRGLARSPLFTAVAVLSIALGIGANTAIFTLVDEVLLRRLPVREPDQLVLFNGPRNHYGSNSGGNMLSYPMYEDFRDNFVDRGAQPKLPRVTPAVADNTTSPPVFSGLFARRAVAMNVGVDGQTERVPGELVSGTYFQVLGVGAAVGRVIAPDDDQVRGGSPVAVLSYDYWRTRFGANSQIVGKTITVSNHALTIIGVSQAGFDGVDIGYVPRIRVPLLMKAAMTPNWDDVDNRRSRWVNVFGRLKPGVTLDQAKASLQPFFHAIIEQEVLAPPFANTTPYTREQFLKGQVDLLPAAQGRSPIRQQLSQPLRLLLGIVAGVLLIACANVASLLIARATARQKEIAVRLALGASRPRIVGQLLVESVLLAALGGLLGLLIAAWTTRFLLGFLPTTDTPHVISGSIDNRILLFNFALSLATGLVFGLVPALRSTRPDLAPTLKDQVGAVVGGSGGVRLRKGLVVAQVTISVLLLVSAGLFIRSLRALRLLDLGLKTDNLIAFNIAPTLSGYTPLQTKQFNKQLVERVGALPGVSAMAFAQIGLLEGNEWDSSMSVEGYEPKPGENMNPYCNAVSPGYFKTMGIPLVAGRDFDHRDVRYSPPPSDTANTPPLYQVAIVNESYAKHYFGDRSPIGRHIGFGINPGTKTPIEIIGVVKDAKYTGVRDDIPRTVYFAFMESDFAGGSVMYVRTSNRAEAAYAAIRQAARDLDANIPVFNLRTLDHQIDQSLLNDRLIAILSTAFGALATILAVIGLYGVMAYTVARRTREIGVRMALGAVHGDVIWLVMREVLILVGSGIVLGLAASAALGRLIASQLYGVTASDPLTIAAAAGLLLAVALLAGYLPARRATRVNPVLALRYE
jgi:predicted permease